MEVARGAWRYTDDARARWASVFWMGLPVLTAVGVAIQRNAVTEPGADTILIALLLLPCVVDLLAARVPLLARIPRFTWTVLTALCVLGLVVRPTATDFAPFFLVMATAEAAVEGPRWRALAAFALSAGVMIGVEIAGKFDGAFIWVLGIALGLVSGIAIRSVVDLLGELRDAEADLAARAAADERQRIAREVHDVVAHTLAVTLLHVTGARLALRRDREEAAAALEQAEHLGRQSLAEVRRIVGLLQPAGTGTAPPLPGANDVPALVDQFRQAGLDVTLRVDGDLARVTPSTGLALYRIAQESLTNVTKHAPGSRAHLRLTVANGTVRVCVTNEAPRHAAPGPALGLGVPGMRERAESLGGAFRAGAHDDGDSWRVEADLPTTAV